MTEQPKSPDIAAKIAAARALEAAASKMPWWRDGRMIKDKSIRVEHICQMEGGMRWAEPDAELIVHARNHHAALWDVVEVLLAIRDYGVSGPRSSHGYPSEVCYDEFAYKRIVDGYRRAAGDALAKLAEAP